MGFASYRCEGDNAELSLGERMALDVARAIRRSERRSVACAALDDFLLLP